MRNKEFEALLDAIENQEGSERTIRLEDIDRAAGTQTRLKISQAVVAQYASDLRDGANLPPAIVWRIEKNDPDYSGSKYVLTWGFHRILAHDRLERPSAKCIVRRGSFKQAMAHALSANAAHGLQRTREDILNSIRMLRERFGRDIGQRAAARSLNMPRSTFQRYLELILAEELADKAPEPDAPTSNPLGNGEVGLKKFEGPPKNEGSKSGSAKATKDPGPTEPRPSEAGKDDTTAKDHLIEWLPQFKRAINTTPEDVRGAIFRKGRDFAQTFGFLIFKHGWGVPTCEAVKRRHKKGLDVDEKVGSLLIRARSMTDGHYSVTVEGFTVSVSVDDATD